MKSVFISSTCYDLIDVREELHSVLSTKGLNIHLSDCLESEFQVYSDRNSIETCLTNVASSDIFIIILSRRYGGSLKNVGYSDISATHLEYKKAIESGIPIYMYVRNRLEAENSINRKNPNVKLSWITSENDKRLFDILEEHKTFSKNKKKNNWYWTFKSSVDLKNRILKDLSQLIGQALIRQGIDQQRMPIICIESTNIIVEINKYNNVNGKVRVVNAGGSVALNLVTEVTPVISRGRSKKSSLQRMGVLLPTKKSSANFNLKLTSPPDSDKGFSLHMTFTYTTESGLRVADTYIVHYKFIKDKSWSILTSEYQNKTFIKIQQNYE